MSQQLTAASIDTTNHLVNIVVPVGTNLNGLIATFTLSPGASAKVNSVNQQCGITTNNYAYPVLYAITAEDNSVQNWIVEVHDNSGVEENSFRSTISVFPNPSTGLINHKSNLSIGRIMITDIAGKLVYEEKDINSTVHVMNLNQLKTGVYFIKLFTGNESSVYKIQIIN